LTARQKVFIPFLFVNSVLIPLFLPAGRQRSQDFLPGRHDYPGCMLFLIFSVSIRKGMPAGCRCSRHFFATSGVVEVAGIEPASESDRAVEYYMLIRFVVSRRMHPRNGKGTQAASLLVSPIPKGLRTGYPAGVRPSGIRGKYSGGRSS